MQTLQIYMKFKQKENREKSSRFKKSYKKPYLILSNIYPTIIS